MILLVDPNLPIPLYRQLADQVVYRIATGELRSEDKLPSIRKLATKLRINTNTIIKAYKELEHGGFAASRHGMGFFISGTGVSPAKSAWQKKSLEKLTQAAKEASAVGMTLEEIIKAVSETVRKGEAL